MDIAGVKLDIVEPRTLQLGNMVELDDDTYMYIDLNIEVSLHGVIVNHLISSVNSLLTKCNTFLCCRTNCQ